MFRVDTAAGVDSIPSSPLDCGGERSLKSEQVCRRENVRALRGCVRIAVRGLDLAPVGCEPIPVGASSMLSFSRAQEC